MSAPVAVALSDIARSKLQEYLSEEPSDTAVRLLVDNGKFAERVSVQLGRTSVSTIEVTEGLSLGDEVILSDVSQWDTVDKIRLK